MTDREGYDRFYTAVEKSAAYARYCRETFGMDFSQQGFCDMGQLHFLMDRLEPGPGQRILDVGCGNGKMLEYILETTGATGEGFDLSPVAIESARKRTRDKADRLTFTVGSLNDIRYPDESFDSILAIDILYFAGDLEETISRLHGWLKPGGKLAAYYSEFRLDGTITSDRLTMDGTLLARALKAAGLPYTGTDCTRSHYEHMKRKRKLLSAMEEEFEAEGNWSLWQSARTESVDETMSYEEFVKFSVRYLYILQKDYS